MKLRNVFAIMLLVLAGVLTGCSGEKDNEPTPTPTPTLEVSQEGEAQLSEEELYANPIKITIEMENGGIMKGEMYPNLAPETVANFKKLIEEKFFDGLIFHRVIPGFMIQGGGYDEEFTPKDTEPIKGEFEANGFKNPLSHERGVLSMARTNDPNSASSQFFIMHAAADYLDGQYAAFGRITEGLDIIDEIANVETTSLPNGMADVPTEAQVIKTITIDE